LKDVTHPELSKKVYLPEADGIRGLACLIVLLAHAVGFNFQPHNQYLQGVGKIGVWLFFCLSSYLLTHQLLFKGLSKKTLIDYSLGRILRIYPPFIIIVFLYYFFGTAGIDNPSDIIKAISLQQGYVHLWTIPVEFKFYFILPAFVWGGRIIYSSFGNRGILVASLMLTILHQVVAPYWLLKDSAIETFQYMPAFLFGGVGAILKFNGLFPKVSEKATTIGILVILGILVVTPFMRFTLLGLPPTDYLMNKYLYFSFAWTVFIFSLINSRGLFHQVLTSSLFTKVGHWSYSIYLVHWLIVNMLIQTFTAGYVSVIAAVAITPIAGFLMYTLFEQPLFKVRKHILIMFHLR